MNKRIILSSLLLLSFVANSFSAEIIKSEKIQKVIVFRNSAQIESRVSQSIERGDHTFIVDALPNSLMEGTVQVAGEGDFTIISVETKTGMFDSKAKGSAYQNIIDSISFYQNLIEMDNIRKYAIDQEESLLITNKNLSSKAATQVVDIEDLADLYRRRLPELKKESYRLQKIIANNTERLNQFKQQLAERQSGKNNKQVWVTVSLNQAQNVKLNLKYMVQDASWSPSYDVRSTDIGEDIQFILKANITQSTGVDWKDVELSLSTGNPMSFTNKPELYDWRLALLENLPIRNINSLSSTSAGAYQADKLESSLKESRANVDEYYVDGVKVRGAKYLESFKTEQVNNIQYNITKSFNINSDGDMKIIEIQRNDVKANYRYVSIPKLDNNAYLLASIKEWDKVLILAGEANIFLKGAYVTKTFIDPMNIDDSLEITLGNDESIKVERKMNKDMTSKKTFGSTKKLNQGFEISVRNTKSKDIQIDIIDQVPLSSDKDIEVKHTANEASFDPETGKLTWKYNIAPAETKKMSFQYEVKYPKNKVLQGW